MCAILIGATAEVDLIGEGVRVKPMIFGALDSRSSGSLLMRFDVWAVADCMSKTGPSKAPRFECHDKQSRGDTSPDSS